MRITNKTLTSNYLRNLNRNLAQVEKYHNQLSSGKEISKPSDNPMLVSKIMSLRDNILGNEQYNSNISDSIGWVDTQDTALGDVSKTLNRVRDLMIYGANGSLSDTDRAAIKDEVEMQVAQMVDILNTNFDGRYIFAGQKTTSKPFKLVSVYEGDGEDKKEIGKNIIYHGDTNNLSREISTGVTIDLITDASQVIGKVEDGEDNVGVNELGIFLQNVLNAFNGEDEVDENGSTGKKLSPDDLSGDLLGKIDVQLDKILRARSKVGAISNRLEASKERNESENLNLKKLLSDREDIDIAEKYIEFSTMAIVYQASLQTGAKILQPSLLDYIR